MEFSDRPGKLDALSLIKINQEKYEREKKERNDRFLKLQQERQRILDEREKILNRLHNDKTIQFPLSRQSNISTNAAVNRARDKIPLYEKKIQDSVDSNKVRRRMMAHPYRGELGIGSYEPWQLEDFYFVREFVQSWVDEVLNFIIIEPSNDYNDNLTSTAEDLQRQLNLENYEMELSKSVKEVQSDIISEACIELISDVVDENLTVHFQSEQAVANMILGAIVTKETDDNTATLIANTYNQMKKERNRYPALWHHSQKFDYLGDETMETAVKEEDTFDGTILSFEGINLIGNISNQALTQDFKNYRLLESKFWSGNSPTVSNLPLPRRYKGVTCAALSSDHSLLAIGTVQGDMAVWNLMVYPPRILKGCKGYSSISQIQWSSDSTQIVTINQRGSIQVWLVGKGGGSVDIKTFEPVTNDGFEASQLTSEVTLEPRDLVFTQGNLASAKSIIAKPTFVVFHPTLTFLGRQECLVVGLSNGNVLKLNLGEKTSLSSAQGVKSGPANQVGKGIEAELFKAHKHPIKLVSFVDNTSEMITVDDEGFIYLWEYTEESLSGYGWFTPSSSYRLEMTQKTFKPAAGRTEKIEFSDVVKGSGRVKELNRRDMIVKRKEMQSFINSLHLGKPWRTTNVGNQKVIYLYAPRSVPESGATFHSVTYYRENKVLAQYSTQLYRPITVNATKMMSCKVNPLGNQLVLSLLFDEVPPKSPHAVFVTIDLTSMKIAPNLMEVPLSLADYKQCETDECCDFDISRQIDATGSQYMVTNVCGTVGGFSMVTTNLVMASSERGWTGCGLSDEQSMIFPTARVLVATQEVGVLCVIFYAPKINTVSLLHIRDGNSATVRHKVWQAYGLLTNIKEGLHPRETLRKHQWMLDGETAFHLHCAMETLVLDLIDKAIQQCSGADEEETESASHSFENRLWPYMRHTVQHSSNRDSPSN